MKLIGTKEIEYWMTTTRNGKIIRVYRVDAPEEDPLNRDGSRPFTLPILVDCNGIGEPIDQIIDERELLRKRVAMLEMNISGQHGEWLKRLEAEINELKKKKWWQIWK